MKSLAEERSSCLSDYIEKKRKKELSKEMYESKKKNAENNFEFYFHDLQEVRGVFNRYGSQSFLLMLTLFFILRDFYFLIMIFMMFS